MHSGFDTWAWHHLGRHKDALTDPTKQHFFDQHFPLHPGNSKAVMSLSSKDKTLVKTFWAKVESKGAEMGGEALGR